MLGKFVIAPNFSYIYISTMELYPTPVCCSLASPIQFHNLFITTPVVQKINFYYVLSASMNNAL